MGTFYWKFWFSFFGKVSYSCLSCYGYRIFQHLFSLGLFGLLVNGFIIVNTYFSLDIFSFLWLCLKFYNKQTSWSLQHPHFLASPNNIILRNYNNASIPFWITRALPQDTQLSIWSGYYMPEGTVYILITYSYKIIRVLMWSCLSYQSYSK